MSVSQQSLKTICLILALSLLPALSPAALTDHPDADSLWAKLEVEAREFRADNRFHEAIRLHEQALKRAESFEQNNRWLAESINNLGISYLSLGDYLKADSLLKEALNMRVLHFGSIHQDVAESYSNIGVLYMALGLGERALTSMQKSLDILKKSPEIDSLEYVIALQNLGASFSGMGNEEKAKEIFFECLEITRSLSEELKPDDASIFISIAGIYLGEQQLDSASEYLKTADSLMNLKENSIHTARPLYYGVMANVHLAREEIDEAIKLYRQGAEVIAASLGDSHPEYGIVTLTLGLLEFRTKKDFVAASKTFEIAYKIFRASYPPSNKYVAQAASLLLVSYVVQQRMDEAQLIYPELFAATDSAYGEQSPEKAQLVKNLMEAHFNLGDYQTAEIYSRTLQSMAEFPTETDERLMAAALEKQVIIYLNYNMFEEALTSSVRLIEALERTRGQASPTLLNPLATMAALYRNAAQKENAGKTFRRLMYIAKKEYHETDSAIAPYYRVYADFLQATGDTTLADSLTSLADKIAPLPTDTTSSAASDGVSVE